MTELYIFRHAERLSQWTKDPKLSPRGMEQAKNLAQWVKESKLPTPQRIVSSPRVRAQQSFTPLSDFLNLKMEVSNLLQDQMENESRQVFIKRIETFLSQTSQKSGVTFAVSHLDWIELAIPYLDAKNLPTSGWMPLQFQSFYFDGLTWQPSQKSGVI
jgi:phosphohistidine phosphatase SixA